jgi:O-antigen ligase
VAWSIVPLFTLVRAVEVGVVVGLTLLHARVWQHHPELGRWLFQRTLRLAVYAILSLALAALVIGARYQGRFVLPLMHPGLFGAYLGVGTLIVLLGGRRITGLPRPAAAMALVVFVGEMLATLTRSAVLATLLAIVGALLTDRYRRGLKRVVLALALLGTALLASSLAGEELNSYLHRGQTDEALLSISGRVPLWQFALDQLSGVRAVVGFGYGSARVLLPEQFPWAGNAHNAWIELALSIGLLGVGMISVLYGSLLHRALGTRSDSDRLLPLALAMLLYLLSVAGVSQAFTDPGMELTLLALMATLLSAPRPARSRQRDVDGHQPIEQDVGMVQRLVPPPSLPSLGDDRVRVGRDPG